MDLILVGRWLLLACQCQMSDGSFVEEVLFDSMCSLGKTVVCLCYGACIRMPELSTDEISLGFG